MGAPITFVLFKISVIHVVRKFNAYLGTESSVTAFTRDDTGPCPQPNNSSHILTHNSLRYVLLWSKPGGQLSVADIATCSRLQVPGIKSRWRRDIPCRPDQPRGLPSLLYNGYRVFPGVKRPEVGAHHPTSSSGGLRKVSYTSTYHLCLLRQVMGWPLWSKPGPSTWCLPFRFPD